MQSGLRIEDYALIGDCTTAALVGSNGSIDWLCLPRFDFGGLLCRTPRNLRARPLADRAGRTGRAGRAPLSRRLADPGDPFRDRAGGGGAHRFHAPAPLALAPCAACPRGTRQGRDARRIRAALRIRLDRALGRAAARGGISAVAGPEMVVLRTPAPLHGEDLKTVGEFTLAEGETVPFVLSYGPSHLPPPRPIDPERALHETETFWRRWSDRCASAGPWTDIVKRSLVVLKGLTYAPTGGIVAAPTTSLPESIGGVRNWDYRYCWLRDATLTLLALMHAGYYDEARSWRDWLLRAVAGSPEQLQIMYGIGGERRLAEWEVPWLPGYEGSRAGAHRQRRRRPDPARRLWRDRGRALPRLSPRPARSAARRGDRPGAARNASTDLWPQPDEGIWEVRGRAAAFHLFEGHGLGRFRPRGQDFRGVRHRAGRRSSSRASARPHPRRNLPQRLRSAISAASSRPSARSRSTRACCCCRWSVSCRRTTRASKAPSRRSNSGSSSTALSCATTAAKASTGCRPARAPFCACSFWLADNYVLQGRTAEAGELFQHLLGLCNDVGLLAEEYDPARAPPARQFPAGLLACRAGQHCLQSDPRPGPGRAALEPPAPPSRADVTTTALP